MLPKQNYYLNDYFDIYKNTYNKEKEYMKTDIYELENNYYLEIDMPGIKKENININYQNGYLTIIGINNTLPTKKESYIRKERLFGELKRSFYIGFKKETDLKARYNNGVLTITFPKEDININNRKNITIA